MTGRTHDMTALTTLALLVATRDIPHMTIATATVAICAACIGGIAPDLDQSTSEFWDHVPAGSIVGKLVAPIIGGHRFLSHSLLGIVLFGAISKTILTLMSSFILVDMNIVWWAFMIGYVSHLVIDMLTREGVPWLFPIPFGFGIPPLRFLRIHTGGLIEKSIIFPGLILTIIYLASSHSARFLDLIK